MKLVLWTDDIKPEEFECFHADVEDIIKTFCEKHKIKKCLFEMKGEAELKLVTHKHLESLFG